MYFVLIFLSEKWCSFWGGDTFHVDSVMLLIEWP